VAAIEYLDETNPSPHRLLPGSPLERAQVRTLAAIIASDTHPLTAPRVSRELASKFVDSLAAERQQAGNFTDWNRQWVHRGLEAYERTLKRAAASPGRYSVGDEVTLADICLLPQAWRARSFGIPLEEFPLIKRVVTTLEGIESLRAVHWDSYN
jgi:maleylacetoacetate isomerase